MMMMMMMISLVECDREGMECESWLIVYRIKRQERGDLIHPMTVHSDG